MCGCLSNKTSSNSKVINKTKLSTNSIEKISVCSDRYKELLDLDVKIITLLRKIKDDILTASSLNIRKWIRNLDRECPDEDELNIIKEYTENEYTKYFK